MRLPLAITALGTALSAACGSYAAGPPAPRTAAEQTALDRAAEEQSAGDGGGAAPVSADGKSWGGWRYQGHRDDCFYVVERECFATLADACDATACKRGCTTRGAGPAIVYCK